MHTVVIVRALRRSLFAHVLIGVHVLIRAVGLERCLRGEVRAIAGKEDDGEHREDQRCSTPGRPPAFPLSLLMTQTPIISGPTPQAA